MTPEKVTPDEPQEDEVLLEATTTPLHEAHASTPATTPVAASAPDKRNLSKIKLAFLYVMIGGLVTSALISVFAILIGEFNEALQKALLTTLIVVAHSSLVLAIVFADTNGRLGKDILPTIILLATIANMLTSTFGIWNIWDNDISWRLFLVYMLVIGVAFLITWIERIKVAHQATKIGVYASIALVGIFGGLIVPWIVLDQGILPELYYRLVAAASILAATTLSVTAIVRTIAVAQHPELKATGPVHEPYRGGMLGILITVGVVVALFWLYGMFAIIGSASTTSYDTPYDYYY